MTRISQCQNWCYLVMRIIAKRSSVTVSSGLDFYSSAKPVREAYRKWLGKCKSKASAVVGPCVLTYSSESRKYLRKTHSLLVLGVGLLSNLSLRSLMRLLSGWEAVLANNSYNNQKVSVPFREKKCRKTDNPPSFLDCQ